MNIEKSLTKENFWNEMMEKFPKATKSFCDWIDEYKKETDWNNLLGGDIKYHDLPYAMQQGVWISFCYDQMDNYFEQSEYSPKFDFEEEVRIVFSVIEAIINLKNNWP